MGRVLRKYGKRFGLRTLNFWSGVLDVFDPTLLFGTRRYRPTYTNPWKADAEALRSDWEAISGDFLAAFRQYDAEVARGQKKKTKKRTD